MNRNLVKTFKLITMLLVIILVVEIVYVVYSVCFKSTVNLYFDSINSIDYSDSSYIAVGSNNNNDNHYEKAKISKYNGKHEKVFEKLYNVGYNSAFFNTIIDGESIVAVGSYEKSKSDHKDSLRRALFVKYDLSGDEIFEKEFSLLDNSKFNSVVSVDDGYIVVGQSIYKSTKIGMKPGGAIIVKYDKDGKFVWSNTYGNNKCASFNDLVVYNGYIYAVGVDEEGRSIICKYDMSGNLVNIGVYQYRDSMGYSDIIVLNDNLYVTGSDKKKAIVVEYDLDCNDINEVFYDTKNTRFTRIISDKDNNIVVIGTMNNKNYDGVIAKYSSNLEKISIVTYGEEHDDYFTDIKYIDNNYIVVGYSSYTDGSYLSKFIKYSDALKVLEVE